MRVAVIGAGGVGGFLGSLLLRAGHDVRFLARGQHLVAINDHGLLLQSKQFGEISSKPVATDDPRQLGPADLVVVAVKMYDFDAAARAAGTALAPTGVAITVQNGLDAPSELATVIGGQHVLTGTASIEAMAVGPGRIAHLIPIHAMTLSELTTGPTTRLEKLASEMRVAGIAVAVAPDGQQALWDKAAGLIPFATLTSAMDSGIGPILELSETRAVFDGLMEEALVVARRSGFQVVEAQARLRNILQQAATTYPRFTSSMSRDFQAARPTELEWLTGKIVRLADGLDLPVPIHRTLYAVLKLKAHRTGQAPEMAPITAPARS